MTDSTALLFMTGTAPGCPSQIGQTFLFGCFSKEAFPPKAGPPPAERESQNIFVRVFISAWISRPIVGVYFIILFYIWQRGNAKLEKFCGCRTNQMMKRSFIYLAARSKVKPCFILAERTK